MRLFYTGATTYLAQQTNARLSLGGFVSNSPVPNAALNGLFGSISDAQGYNGGKDIRGIVFRNETGSEISRAELWYENNSETPLTSYRMAIVAVGQDNCNNIFIEKVPDSNSVPLNASFTDNRGRSNALDLPAIPVNGFVGIWIQRVVNSNAYRQTMDCQNLFALHTATPTAQVQTVTTRGNESNFLNSKYFYLNTSQGQYYIWFDSDSNGVNPNVASREGIRVSISEDDESDEIATQLNSKLNEILVARGEITTSVERSVITITNTQTGQIQGATPENSGFTISVTTNGVSGSLEQVEDVDLFINF